MFDAPKGRKGAAQRSEDAAARRIAVYVASNSFDGKLISSGNHGYHAGGQGGTIGFYYCNNPLNPGQIIVDDGSVDAVAGPVGVVTQQLRPPNECAP